MADAPAVDETAAPEEEQAAPPAPPEKYGALLTESRGQACVHIAREGLAELTGNDSEFSISCPGRGAASLDDAPQTRDPGFFADNRGPGSAVHHFAALVLHRVRDTRDVLSCILTIFLI